MAWWRMSSTPPTDPAVFELLKSRLRDAELETNAALANTPDDHPLVDPTRKLLDIHREIRATLLESFPESTSDSGIENDPSVVAEAVQIEREHHEAKGEFLDVVKALFMWRDDPVERVRQKSV